MINLGHNWDLIHWPDDWTATTVDGKRTAQFEETLLWDFFVVVSHSIRSHSTNTQNHRDRGRSFDGHTEESMKLHGDGD